MRSAHNRQPDYQALQEAERDGALDGLKRPDLNKKQVEFLAIYCASPFMPLKELCRLSGVHHRTVTRWKDTSEPFQRAMDIEHRRSQQVVNMSRKSVMRGLLEAIDMAKDQRQPGGMISGWKEIGRMCGFYEPEKREILLSVNSQELIAEMKNLPREKLLELASEQDALDGEFEVVDKA
jgi:hypothetical protein